MPRLFKRKSIWYAYVPKRGGGVRRVGTNCTDKRAAELRAGELERESLDPAYAAAEAATTQELLSDYFLSRKRLGRAEGTLHHVRMKAGALVGLYPMRAAEIEHSIGERYIDTRLAEGARRTTIKKELRVLKAALRLANKNKKWLGDPDAVIPELEDDSEPRTRALSPWELVALVNELEDTRAAHVVWIVATGSRWGESVRAQDGDWDPKTGMARIRGTKTKRASRTVPVRGGLATSMIGWALGKHAPPFDRWSNVRRDLAEACKRARITAVSPNDLRRTFGTWLRNVGVTPDLIGAAMGHVDSRMVERVYGRLTPEALGRLLEARTGGPPTAGACDGCGGAHGSERETIACLRASLVAARGADASPRDVGTAA